MFAPKIPRPQQQASQPHVPPSNTAAASKRLQRRTGASPWAAGRPPLGPGAQRAPWMEHTSVSRTPPAPVTPAPKLEVGSSSDPLEHEADRVAEQLTRPLPPRPAVEPAHAEPVSPSPAADLTEAPRDIEALIAGGGQPLEDEIRARFESMLGMDLAGVRTHIGAQASASAASVGASAYTVGRDIVFGEGHYAPRSGEGHRLLAHELAHVAQQGAAPVTGPLRVSQPHEPTEQLAEQFARQAVSGHVAAPAMPRVAAHVAREKKLHTLEERLMDRLDAHERALHAGRPDTATQRQEVLDKVTAATPAERARVLGRLTPASPEKSKDAFVQYFYNPEKVGLDLRNAVLDALAGKKGEDKKDDKQEKAKKAISPAEAEVAASTLLAYIQAEAQKRAKETRSVSKDSMLYKRLTSHFLPDYLANPSAKTGKKAIEKIGEPFNDKPHEDDFWENTAINQWNKQKLPPGIERIRPDLPKTITAATQVLSLSDRRHLNYVDAPQLIGRINTSVDEDDDVKKGGKNVSQLMHWATGVKYSGQDKTQMRELFLAYENWHMEGWDIFGEDSINDMITEDPGQLLGKELAAGTITEANLQERLNVGFGEARAWVGSLIRARRSQLDQWILAKKQAPTNYWWREKMEIWQNETIYEHLLAGNSIEDTKKWGFTQRLIDIYALAYEADEWEKTHGKIPTTPLIEGLLAGKFNDILKKAANNEEIGSSEIDKARKDADGGS